MKYESQGYYAQVIADSVQPNNKRLTTMEVRYPRFIHSEMMTHRDFSRNAGSSRAIPVAKQIERVMHDPVTPIEWGRNQKGMQADQAFTGEDAQYCENRWRDAREAALAAARHLSAFGAHKQVVNRLLEPYSWITVIISSTRWDNFFRQRVSPLAQPEMQHIANLMQIAYQQSQPKKLDYNEWHMPYVLREEWDSLIKSIIKPDVEETLRLVSAARCARVSYLNQDGQRDIGDDLRLAHRLVKDGHWSPFEHVAQSVPTFPSRYNGNFGPGWKQLRKTFEGEYYDASSMALTHLRASGQ